MKKNKALKARKRRKNFIKKKNILKVQLSQIRRGRRKNFGIDMPKSKRYKKFNPIDRLPESEKSLVQRAKEIISKKKENELIDKAKEMITGKRK